MKIIGISGKAGAGKDTVARILRSIIQKDYSCTKLSFAGKLKDICVMLFGWDRERLEGDYAYKEGNTLDNGEIDPACAMLGMTRRQVLQIMGTEGMRHGLHQDIWIIALKLAIMRGEFPADVGFLTDCRFKNELQFVRDMGGYLIRVDRVDGIETLTKHTDHASETDWLDWDDWDSKFENYISPDLNETQNLVITKGRLNIITKHIMRTM